MKVAWILPGGVDRSGERRVIPAVLWLVERLATRTDLHVFALRQETTSTRYPLLGATVHAAGSPGRRLRALAALRSEHGRAPFDVLYASGGISAEALAALAGRGLGRPVVVHLTGGELVAIPELGYGGRLRARGRVWGAVALGGAARIAALSDPVRRQVEALGYSAVRVPFGVDRTAWPATEPRPRADGETARLLHVGSLNPVKDQGTLMEAMAVLRDRDVPFRLDVVGEDTLGGAVQRRARDLGLGGHVRFHGFLENEAVRERARSAHLLLVSSRHEAGPVVALEAALAGVPTVGTAVGLLTEWAPDAAVVVPVGDAEALATATLEVLHNDARRIRMAHLAQERALEEDADRSAELILDLLEQAMRSAGPSR